jgi:Flp pilus assembly pilin Flp
MRPGVLRARRRVAGEQGATAVEYGLIVAGCALVAAGGIFVLNAGVSAALASASAGASGDASVPGDPSSDPVPADSPSATPTPTTTPTVLPTSASPTPTPTTASPTPTPTPTSASPTPTPTSASPSPTRTTASPTPTPTPTATRPKDAIDIRAGESDKESINAGDKAKSFDVTVDPASAGSAEWISGDIVFTASRSVASGTVVTVSWSYVDKGKTVSGTITYWIT